MSSELLPSGCGVCGQQENLLQCTGCQVLLYCGRDHEIDDRLSHKSICRSMLRSRVTMEKEEQILRSPPEKFMMFGDAFIHHVGNFWGLTETRKYMRARLALVDGILPSVLKRSFIIPQICCVCADRITWACGIWYLRSCCVSTKTKIVTTLSIGGS